MTSWLIGPERDLSEGEAVRVVLRALGYVRPLWREFAVKLLYALASLVPGLLLPWPLKIMVDHVINGDPITPGLRFPSYLLPFVEGLAGASRVDIALAVTLASGVLVALVGGFGVTRPTRVTTAEGLDSASSSENRANFAESNAGGLLGWFEYRWQLRLSQRLNHRYRSQAFERVQKLPLVRFAEQSIGDALYRILYDTPGITSLVYAFAITPLIAGLQIGLAAWVLHDTYPEVASIAGLALLALPVCFLATLPFAPAIRRSVELSRSTGAATTRTVEEVMSNVLAVQSQGGLRREEQRFAIDSWTSYSAMRRYVLLTAIAGAASALAGAALGLYVFWLVTDAIFAGSFTAGDFAVILAFYVQVGGSVAALAGLWIQSQNQVAALKRVFWIMDQPGEEEPGDTREIGTIRQGIELQDVDYSYPDGTQALRRVSFEARIGQMIGIVGPAAAGKTTLAYLIPRFLDPTNGIVRVDGIDTRSLTRASLRSQISFVFQETSLLDASVEDNIRVGKLGASDREVRRAAEAAGAHEFIEALPKGYRTLIGRDGNQLSIGQRQRIAIARALVRQAPILILDEPSSALDAETEQILVRTLHAEARHSLVVVIAHRLSTIRSADTILFLDRGRLRETGTHDELMALPNGRYRQFVEIQSRS